VSHPNRKIQGGGYVMPELKFLDRNHVDGYVQVTDEEAIGTARQLARVEGLFAGFSSGANVAAALRLLRGELQGKTIAVLLCDSGLKYPSTELWE
jgi:cysteine synthase A